MSGSIFNPDLFKMARASVKQAFVDPAAAGGGGAAPAPEAAAMAGPMPPMPAMMPGDPSAGGGGAPADPLAGGAPPAGGGVTADEVKAIVEQLMAQGGGAAGGAGGAGAGGQKMKVDVNQEIYQIKKLLVAMAKQMDMPIDPTMLLGDPAMDPAIPQEQAAQDPASAAATESGQGFGSAINPIDPIQGASPALAGLGGGGGEGGGAEQKAANVHMQQGRSFNMTESQHNNGVSHPSAAEGMSNKAAALATQLRQLHRGSNAA